MKNLKLFSILAVFVTALSFTSCNSDSDNSYQLPSKQEAFNMLSKVSGYHPCGILFPGDETDKNNIIKKDSVYGNTDFYVNERDSSYTISNFPVSLLAKYIKDESISKAVAALPNQNLKGKLLPYDPASTLFGSVTDNITFKNASGDDVVIAFYAGYNNYALAGYATNQTTKKQSFMMYLTMGAIYVNKQQKTDALKYQTGYYGSAPYIVYLQYNL